MKRLLLASALCIAWALPAGAAEQFNDPSTGGTVAAAGMPDFSTTQSLAANSTSNAAVFQLAGGKGVVAFQLIGLTASGATLVPQYTNDPLSGSLTHWTTTSFDTGVANVTVDGAARMDSVGHTAVRLLVSVAGTGTITVEANAASVAGNRVFTTPVPIAYLAQSSILLTTTVGTASTQLTNPNAASHALLICTNPAATANIWLNLAGGAAVVNQGTPVYGYGGCTPINPPPTAAIYGISDGTSSVPISASGG